MDVLALFRADEKRALSQAIKEFKNAGAAVRNVKAILPMILMLSQVDGVQGLGLAQQAFERLRARREPETVHVAACRGTRFHLPGCGHIRNSQVRAYTACRDCIGG